MGTPDFRDDEFFKSTFSMHVWPQKCVQVAVRARLIGVRNSSDPEKITLCFSREEWDAFIRGAKAGEFDLPGTSAR